MNLKKQVLNNTGTETLEVISQADRFNFWMYSKIKPNINGSILEIGSGIGNISKHLISDFSNVTLSDYKEEYVNILKNKFDCETHKLDISTNDIHDELINKFDTIVILNVLEHIENEARVLNNCKKLLKQNGTLIVLVPAYQKLYNSFDVELEHIKRYNKSSLSKAIQAQQLSINKIFYFNAVGILGWYISGSILRKKLIPTNQMALYNRLIPFIKLIDILFFQLIGLSVIAISKKI
ncbi:MAG: hypothetical protein A2033_04140 [Bacteroidetes bacterium GWA2_31_9]|nr:MAG: hypothetical protein A2033_04140 [Bacteroidetes bacterium GWA2_31_9]